MKGVSYLFLYVPICWVILLVLETCRSDDARRILRRTVSNFLTLTGVLAAGGTLIYFVNRYL
ncbi:MAG: hypothetical protein ACK44W_14695 [Planctomycetota bacterium]